jgi:hypothetical protein
MTKFIGTTPIKCRHIGDIPINKIMLGMVEIFPCIIPSQPPKPWEPSELLKSIAGMYYDISDRSTLWRDVARTLPVTAGGQTVAVIEDKSANNNDIVITDPLKRPTYQTSKGLHWLDFDGVADAMQVISSVAWDSMFWSFGGKWTAGLEMLSFNTMTVNASTSGLRLGGQTLLSADGKATSVNMDTTSLDVYSQNLDAPTLTAEARKARKPCKTMTATGGVSIGTIKTVTVGGNPNLTGNLSKMRMYQLFVMGRKATPDEIILVEDYIESKLRETIVWAPYMLFAANDDGVFYNFTNLPTVTPDSFGSVQPTKGGDLLAYALDQRIPFKELCADPMFDHPALWTETTGNGWVVQGGSAKYTNNPGINSYLNIDVPELVQGKTYRVSFNVTAGPAENFTAYLGGSQMPWQAGTGWKTALVTVGASKTFNFRSGSSTGITVSALSISEVSDAKRHVKQATQAAKPVFCPRINQQLYSEDFTNTAYRKTGVTVTPNSIAAPDGTMSADTIVCGGTDDNRFDIYPTFYGEKGKTVTVSMHFRKVAGIASEIRMSQAPSEKGAKIDTSTLAVTNLADGVGTIEDLGDNWYRFSITFVLTEFNFVTVFFDKGVVSTASTPIWGLQAEYGDKATRYQRVNAANDYDWETFLTGVGFDGVDDTLVSEQFDLAGDTRTVFWVGFKDSPTGPLFNKGYYPYGAGGEINSVDDGYNSVGFGGGLQYSTTGTPTPSLDSVIATIEPATPRLEIMIDGTPSVSTAVQGGTANTNAPVALGSGQGYGPLSKNRTLACLLINRALTTDEKAKLNAWGDSLIKDAYR